MCFIKCRGRKEEIAAALSDRLSSQRGLQVQGRVGEMESTLQVRRLQGLACSAQRPKRDMIPTYKHTGVEGGTKIAIN